MTYDIQNPAPEPGLRAKKGVMLTWHAESFRSAATARVFGLTPHYLTPPGGGPLRKALFYPVALIRTLRLLRRERPGLIACMNLPAFLPLSAALYGVMTRTPVVMDFHSGGLTSPLWGRFGPLYRMIARRAPFTLCHNRVDADQIRSWGARVALTACLPVGLDRVTRRPAPTVPKILACCSFAPDEPIDLMFEAMRRAPEILFEVTGNYQKRGISADQLPSNVTLLGHLPYEEYLDRMAGSTGVLTLSDRPHIMQMAIHEALALGVPVLTNRSATLEPVLERAGVFCDLTAEGVLEGARGLVSVGPELRAVVPEIRSRRLKELGAELERVRDLAPNLFEGTT